MRTLVWFRGKDLRMSDHAPLCEAVRAGEVIPLFVFDPYFFSSIRAAELPHRMQFLLESLKSLHKNLQQRGGELLLAEGHSLHVVPKLARQFRVDQVVAHRWTEPFARRRDETVAARLHVPFRLFEGETLLPPESIRTKTGQPYSVFTPFSRAVRRQLGPLAQLRVPRVIPGLPEKLERTGLLKTIPSLSTFGLTENSLILKGGEAAAHARLKCFLKGIDAYEAGRDRLGEHATSRLSADLKFGTISVRQAYEAARQLSPSGSKEKFLSQLIWREFAYSCLWDRPELLRLPFRSDFASFPWNRDEQLWSAWAEGRTGYPIVDASARQLLTEGYVHNRARMISASFLTKHLLVDYRLGEAHYLKYLCDGDFALNNMGWQWSAGCGVDAQPYFRVFNPIAQGEKFDPKGVYVRRYLPELARLPDKYIHQPWSAPVGILQTAGIALGEVYPLPIVDHATARARFLALAKAHLKGPRIA